MIFQFKPVAAILPAAAVISQIAMSQAALSRAGIGLSAASAHDAPVSQAPVVREYESRVTNRQVTAWGKMRGEFQRALVFPRSAAYAAVKVTVEAPASIGLRVKATGSGAAETVDENAGLERHTIAITPESYAPEEAGAVSVLDREPMVLMSTFKSYEEFGASYGRDAVPKAAVTPDIAVLADKITDGIADRKARAIAIDAWMKTNIRYVGVYLSFGRIVPNDAATVLTNRFGDCKDKATLMMALLAAKGIAAEQVLVNLGDAYTVTELPTSIAFDHVILYLPEFGLYDDPTADLAAFAVLSFETYDKPVVRVSANGATFARTPTMKPGDHTSRRTTIVNVAADGAVTGRTEDSDTGALAIGLRVQGEHVQGLGGAAAARRFLQQEQTPGTGQFDLGQLAGTADPAVITGTFALDKRFEVPSSDGRAALPVGLSLNGPPGSQLLGRRLSGRTSAFVCHAGRQVEDIEVTFAPPWPLPQLPEPVVIDNPVFSYRVTATVDARTVKLHREFVSRVEHQACAPELEATIAPDMDKVRLNASNRFAFGSASATAGGPSVAGGAAARPNAALALGPAAPAPVALPPPAAQYMPAALHPSQPLELVKAAAAGEKLRVDSCMRSSRTARRWAQRACASWSRRNMAV
jgi:transglutaminase-like putative cysteine protease